MLTPRRSRRRQMGQTLMAFALSMGLFLFAWAGLVADLSFAYTNATRANTAALIGSRSGANDVDTSALFSGGGIFLSGGAAGVCRTAANNVMGGGATVSCTVSGGRRITAVVHKTVTLPLGIFGATVVVGSTQVACLEVGTTTPDSTTC